MRIEARSQPLQEKPVHVLVVLLFFLRSVPSPSDSLSSVPSEAEVVETQEVTAENAAAILAADDDIDDPDANETDRSHRGKPSRRTLLTIGGLAATAAVGTGAYLTIRRTNQGVIGAHEALPLVIGGDICAAPLYAAYHRVSSTTRD